MKYSEFSRHVQIIFQKKRTEEEREENKRGKKVHTHNDNDHIEMKTKSEKRTNRPATITKRQKSWSNNQVAGVTTNRVSAQARLENMRTKLSNGQPKKMKKKIATRDEHHVKWTTKTHKNYEWHTRTRIFSLSPCRSLSLCKLRGWKKKRFLCVHYHSCLHNSHSHKRM